MISVKVTLTGYAFAEVGTNDETPTEPGSLQRRGRSPCGSTCHAAGSASEVFHIFADSDVGDVPFTSNATVYTVPGVITRPGTV